MTATFPRETTMTPDSRQQGGMHPNAPTPPDGPIDPERPDIPDPDEDPLMNEEEGGGREDDDPRAVSQERKWVESYPGTCASDKARPKPD